MPKRKSSDNALTPQKQLSQPSLPASNHQDSPSKRQKLGSTPLTTSPKTPSRPVMDAMYTFTSRTPDAPRFNHHTGARKLVVKNIRPQTSFDPKAYLSKIWAELDRAIDQIFAGQSVQKEELYRGCENVCRQGNAAVLYARLVAKCEARLQVLVWNDLEPVLEAWTMWKRHMSTIHAIFYFMDRSYLLASSKPTIAELTPSLFADAIGGSRARIIQDACDLVAVARDGQESALLSEAVNMFTDLGIYDLFEEQFLGESRVYAGQWSASALPVSDYIVAANALIERELARVKGGTQARLLAILEDELVAAQLERLTEAAPLAELLTRDDPALATLYAFLARRSLGSRLRIPFEKWITENGTAIVFGNEDIMIQDLLVFQRRLDNIWKGAFQKDESLGHGLRESFEIFMNKTKKGDATWGTDNTKVGEMIAKYVDILLRGGAKTISEPARRASIVDEDDEEDDDALINDQLNQVLDLFRFVHGKAVFEAFYKRDLARRLLMQRSASADAERSMLTRLKTECGSGFTQNLEQMFKDIELAREEMQAYKQRTETTLDMNVNILSAAAWPTYPDIPVVIPQTIRHAIDKFELHYKHKHTGRKLDWKHALAHCQMKASFPKGSKELVVSSFQAVVLLLFNGLADGDTLTYQHILSQSGLPPAEVKRTLQSLACAKLQPLAKHPRGREIDDTDVFSINEKFSHPKYRVKINQVQLKETKQENKETHMRVAEDRNFECQAAIVRIMKSRKTIGHSELVSEVIKATMSRGVLAVGDIKKNIDRLIEKDYMEREDGGGYAYVA